VFIAIKHYFKRGDFMNIRFFKASIVAIALLSTVSAFAPDVRWINNSDQDLTSEFPRSGGIERRVIEKNGGGDAFQVWNWSNNPDTSSEFSRILNTRLFGSGYEAKIQFLDNYGKNEPSQMKVIVDSPYTKSQYTYNIDYAIVEITVDKDKTIDINVKDPNTGEEVQAEETR
jgi:hypothetical protein